jgi:mRNA deadenylase 3'-5' endonuclease subunit Ccr4
MKTVVCGLAVLVLNISLMSQNIKVMTYNLRVEVRSDTVNGWDNRKEALTSLVRFYNPDIIGTQEGR